MDMQIDKRHIAWISYDFKLNYFYLGPMELAIPSLLL